MRIYGKLTLTTMPGSILKPVIYGMGRYLYLLDALDRAIQVYHSLMDSHLKSVPSIATLAAWGLPARYPQSLRWDSHWPSELVVEFLGLLKNLVADILQGLGILGRKSESIAVENPTSYLILLSSSGASSPLVFSLSLSILIIVMYNTTHIHLKFPRLFIINI